MLNTQDKLLNGNKLLITVINIFLFYDSTSRTSYNLHKRWAGNIGPGTRYLMYICRYFDVENNLFQTIGLCYRTEQMKLISKLFRNANKNA
jgi:hypothetical protein